MSVHSEVLTYINQVGRSRAELQQVAASYGVVQGGNTVQIRARVRAHIAALPNLNAISPFVVPGAPPPPPPPPPPPLIPPLNIIGLPIPAIQERVLTTHQLTYNGGNPALAKTWNLTANPAWITINPNTGLLNVNPPAGSRGPHMFQVSLNEVGNPPVAVNVTLTVNAPPPPPPSTTPSWLLPAGIVVGLIVLLLCVGTYLVGNALLHSTVLVDNSVQPPTNKVVAAATPPATASYPLAGQTYNSPQGAEYDATWTSDGRLWQPNLPQRNLRKAHSVGITIEEGSYAFNGVSCKLFLDAKRNGNGSKNPIVADHGNNVPFKVQTDDHGQAWALVECDGDQSTGFEIKSQ